MTSSLKMDAVHLLITSLAISRLQIAGRGPRAVCIPFPPHPRVLFFFCFISHFASSHTHINYCLFLSAVGLDFPRFSFFIHPSPLIILMLHTLNRGGADPRECRNRNQDASVLFIHRCVCERVSALCTRQSSAHL